MPKATPEAIEESLRNRAARQRELQAHIISGLAGIAGLAQSAQRRWEERWEVDQLAADVAILVQLCLGLSEPELRYREVLTDISELYEQQRAARAEEAGNAEVRRG